MGQARRVRSETPITVVEETMRHERIRPSIEMVVESAEEIRAIAIERSREAAERLWNEIVRLLAGDPLAPPVRSPAASS